MRHHHQGPGHYARPVSRVEPERGLVLHRSVGQRLCLRVHHRSSTLCPGYHHHRRERHRHPDPHPAQHGGQLRQLLQGQVGRHVRRDRVQERCDDRPDHLVEPVGWIGVHQFVARLRKFSSLFFHSVLSSFFLSFSSALNIVFVIAEDHPLTSCHFCKKTEHLHFHRRPHRYHH